MNISIGKKKSISKSSGGKGFGKPGSKSKSWVPGPNGPKGLGKGSK